MRLVDGEQRDGQAWCARREQVGLQTLGREVEDLVAPELRVGPELLLVSAREAAVRHCGADASGVQRVYLVAHERDKRRDDEREAWPHERRHLVDEAFAAARREHRERVASVANRCDGLGLTGPERIEAPPLAEHVERCSGGSIGSHPGS